MIPRGIRMNNPGNLRESPGDKTQWLGERATDDDPIFEEFTAPEYGIRAIARVIRTYYERHGCNTVRQIIDRWAPANENDTASYIQHVADRCGVGADQVIDPRSVDIMTALVAAIILHENGQQPYDDATIRTGVLMA